MQNLSEWFDPSKEEHLKAYKALQDTGNWPLAFWNKMKEYNIVPDTGWSYRLMAKLADAYMKEKVG